MWVGDGNSRIVSADGHSELFEFAVDWQLVLDRLISIRRSILSQKIHFSRLHRRPHHVHQLNR